MKIDTCGTSCPQPVLMTKKALDANPGSIEVIVDNNTSRTNVKKFLLSRGYSVEVESHDDISTIKGLK
nr:sulfurtransferase TusA family protein [Sedimentibacter sp.]